MRAQYLMQPARALAACTDVRSIGESGLVPEEYVRLLRDMHTLAPEPASEMNPSALAPESAAEHTEDSGHRPAVVSTFSTSSQDLYPLHLRPESAALDNTKDRVGHIRREQELALEIERTPTLRSDTFEVKVNGDNNAHGQSTDDAESKGASLQDTEKEGKKQESSEPSGAKTGAKTEAAAEDNPKKK